MCIIFLPLWDSLRAGTASLQSTAQLSHSAAQRFQFAGNFSRHTSVSAKFHCAKINYKTTDRMRGCVILSVLGAPAVRQGESVGFKVSVFPVRNCL